MARDYGKFYTGVWGDPDFRSLGRNAQHLYMQLISQPDLSMAGVLTIAPVRWAQQSGITETEVMDALATLTEHRFVHVDQGTQELLVRSFVRRDEGWRSPLTMKAIASAMNAVLSVGLKAALAEEVRRIDASALSEKISERTGRSTKEVVMGYIASFLASVIPHPIPLPIPHPKGYPNGLNDFRHTNANATATEHAPAPANAPANAPTPKDSSTAAAADMCEPDPWLFTEFWKHYPRKVRKDEARKAFRAACKKHNPDEIVAAAANFARDLNLPDEQFIPHPATWLRQGGYNDGPLPPRVNSRDRPAIPATTRKVQAASDLVARLQAEEAADYPPARKEIAR